MKVFSLAKIYHKEHQHQEGEEGEVKHEKQVMSQLLRKSKAKIREDQANRQYEKHEYTPIDVGLTMKSMAVVHKIRKQNHRQEQQRYLNKDSRNMPEKMKINAPTSLDSTLPKIKEPI